MHVPHLSVVVSGHIRHVFGGGADPETAVEEDGTGGVDAAYDSAEAVTAAVLDDETAVKDGC